MPIDFTEERWAKVRADWTAWWEGRLERPIIPLVVKGGDPGRAPPAVEPRGRTASYDASVPAEAIVDVWDWQLAGREFLGDAFPHVWPNFGPGVLAAFLGARTEVSKPPAVTVWFQPDRDVPLAQRDLALDIDHPWVRRIAKIMRAAGRRWQGLVQVAMTDLGGAVDVLASFYPGEKMLLALVDHPEAVERLTWQIHEAWWAAFEHFDAILRRTDPGWSAWAGLFAPRSHYMLQCDFAYMIGPRMFERFVRPELAATCRRLDDGFYHLDGVGQLPHLDLLLEIPELAGVQWVPGAGQPPPGAWPEVYERILAAGKRVQFTGTLEDFDRLVQRLGTARGIALSFQTVKPEGRDKALRKIEAYGVS